MGKGGDHFPNQRRRFLQKGTVVPFPRYSLWTAEIQVHGVAEGGYVFGGGEEIGGRVGAELDYEGAVKVRVAVQIWNFFYFFFFCREGSKVEWLEMVVAEGLRFGEEAGVQHGGVS